MKVQYGLISKEFPVERGKFSVKEKTVNGVVNQILVVDGKDLVYIPNHEFDILAAAVGEVQARRNKE